MRTTVLARVRGTAVVAVTAAGLVAAASPPAVAGGGVDASASGATAVHLGKEIFGVPVTMRLLAYYAARRADGSITGSFRYDYTESGHRNTYRGRVTCLAVQADRAWIGGQVTTSDDPTALRAWVWWQVDDGTQLGLADETTFLGFGTRSQTAAYCHDRPYPRHIFDVNSGGLTVTGG